jgi:hypothetical protein
MVSSGRMREAEERLFPRDRYWERWFPGSGFAALCFEDVPALAAYQTADGSHMHKDDARAFSRDLGRLLRPMLPSGAPPIASAL